jgi:DUF917 family protein
MYSLTSFEEIEALVYGATFFGTGGGGDPVRGLNLLLKSFKMKKKIDVIDIEELSEEEIIVCPYYVGTIAPTAKTRKAIKIENPIGLAIKKMENVLGKKVGAIVASELGGSNTAVAISIATEIGIPIIDGDLLGRAAPELHQCTVHIFEIPMYPSILVTETGNIVMVEKYADIDDYESIARYLSVLAGRFVVVVDTPLNKENGRKAIIKGTISKCIEVGKIIKESKEKKKALIGDIIKATNGWEIFEGVIKKYDWKDEGGFLYGEVFLEGINKWKNHNLKSWIKNEHIMVWRDNKPIVMPPDLMSFILDDGTVVTNSDLKEGMKVHAIAVKSPEIWRTKKGLELFGPRHFGFDIDYVPIEKLISET